MSTFVFNYMVDFLIDAPQAFLKVQTALDTVETTSTVYKPTNNS